MALTPSATDTVNVRDRPPVLIVGISQRSGTNYLASVLQCHAQLSAPAMPLAEDMLLRRADLLKEYSRATARRWPAKWGDGEPARADLLRHLGDGLLEFLNAQAGGRAVTKTPFTDNLALVPELFPTAPLLLLVRDGRSVVESLIRGFGALEDEAIHAWRRGARDILRFQADHAEGAGALGYTIVRYERLVEDFDTEVARILSACGLDTESFDWDSARQLPVVGSSFSSSGSVTWEPEARAPDFRPDARAEGWSTSRQARFVWLAGAEQEALGYPVDRATPMSPARQRARDLTWPMRIGARRIKGRSIVAAGAAKRRWSPLDESTPS